MSKTKTKTKKKVTSKKIAPKKIKVGGVIYTKVPGKIMVGGHLYVIAVKGRGLGTPSGGLAKPTVGPKQTSKGNSKMTALPAGNPDVQYLRGKGK